MKKPRTRFLVALAAVVTVAVTAGTLLATGPHTETATPTAGPVGPAEPAKDYVVGLMTRSGPPTSDLLTYQDKPLIEGFVIQVNWRDVQPHGPDDLVTADIDNQLDFAKAHHLPVRLRVYAGYNSPQWVLDKAGSVGWQGTPNDGGPSSYQVPMFWKPAFQQLWQAFDKKLASKYDTISEVREVVPGMCITNFAEPFIRQFSETVNIFSARANGYTDALNNQCLQASIDTFKADWPTTNMAIALNPYQSADDPKGDKLAEPTVIANYCVTALAERCVLGNNSMKGSTRGSDYDALYKMMASLKAPLYIQTASEKKINDWQAALTNSVNIGALSIELPAGYQSFDRGALQGFNDELSHNRQRLKTR